MTCISDFITILVENITNIGIFGVMLSFFGAVAGFFKNQIFLNIYLIEAILHQIKLYKMG